MVLTGKRCVDLTPSYHWDMRRGKVFGRFVNVMSLTNGGTDN